MVRSTKKKTTKSKKPRIFHGIICKERTWSSRTHKAFLFVRKLSKQLQHHIELIARTPSSEFHFFSLKKSPACSLNSQFFSFESFLSPFSGHTCSSVGKKGKLFDILESTKT